MLELSAAMGETLLNGLLKATAAVIDDKTGSLSRNLSRIASYEMNPPYRVIYARSRGFSSVRTRHGGVINGRRGKGVSNCVTIETIDALGEV